MSIVSIKEKRSSNCWGQELKELMAKLFNIKIDEFTDALIMKDTEVLGKIL